MEGNLGSINKKCQPIHDDFPVSSFEPLRSKEEGFMLSGPLIANGTHNRKDSVR